MEQEQVKVFQIDLDMKNILVICGSEDQEMDANFKHWFEDVAMRLQEWMIDEALPLFILGTVGGVEIKLEKIADE